MSQPMFPETVRIRVTANQKKSFRSVGGAPWFRDLLEVAQKARSVVAPAIARTANPAGSRKKRGRPAKRRT